MEVASGEYGDVVPILVAAVNSIKNGKNVVLKETESGMQLQGVSNVTTNISNDISKVTANNIVTPNKIHIKSLVANTNDSTNFQEFEKCNTIINVPNNDEINSQTQIKQTPSQQTNDVCTTSLLDSNDSVVTLPNKNTFPTSGTRQFWILLIRAFKTILRDKQLMHMRLASHVIVGAIIGMIYYDIGNDAFKVMSNAGCIFFTSLFTMFTGLMPTILTCT